MGYDINPMAYWIVQREIEHIDLDACRREAETLRRDLAQDIGHLYRTRCLKCENLTETADRQNPGPCTTCGAPLSMDAPAKRNRCICPQCANENTYLCDINTE